ncbi:Rpn family recombination-promoting nuclease/putative transposase [Ferroacidibacillus organovorans]|uniref:Transposase n=1 Tax=Ferroacidibacillus organovorans TaxID=1765683 RepID=A0A101XRC1_9BACL|nr:Rpn family recombination-promoting nuclease/putative transposase [Ferroacidibacillus organovorans]KUO96135.1 transposase [Ferroacidibacillus organovorans]
MALMDLKIDFAFKALFGSPGSEAILIAFLNAALKRSGGNAITSVDLINPELGPRYLDDKKSILDIHARTEDGTRINIEIQLTNRQDMEKRTLYYWSCIFSDQMQKGMSYSELAQTITINILNFRYVRATEAYHTTFHLYEDTDQFLLTDALEIHFMEIPKLLTNWRKRTVSLHEDRLVRWLLLLEAAEDDEIRNELETIAKEDPVMKEAFEKWEDISRDPQALAEYHSRRMAILDEASAIREAELREQRALLEGKREIVKQLILKGFDIETICEVSGLSRKEIDELSKHLQ